MAGIDTSMYGRLQPMDLFGSFQRGMEMKNTMEQRDLAKQDLAHKADIQKAYQAGIVQNPDGSTSYDIGKAQSALGMLTGNPYAGEAAYNIGNTQYTRDQASQKSLADKEKELWDRDYKNRALQSSAADRAEARAERRSLLQNSLYERKEAKLDDQTQKLSKELSGTQDASNALDEIEGTLGFPISEAEVENGNIYVGGNKVDLPGVSFPGVGRVSFYNSDARNLQGAASKVFNTVLKDRSGAAVVNSELARLKTEFGEGKFNTEAELVSALQRYKRAVNAEMKNREAGYSPEVRERYSSRGGRVSQLSGRPTDKIRKSQQSATVFKGSEIEW
nr:hypothetical protein BdHM001_18400 [Bdellovibrio sp. HM001]